MKARVGSQWGWIGVVLALVLAMSLAACSDDESEDATDTPSPSATAEPQAADASEAGLAVQVSDPWVRATVSGGMMPMEEMDEAGEMAEGTPEDMSEDMGEETPDAESASDGEMSGEMSGAMDLITAAFMTLENTGEADQRLVAVESDITDTVEIHETTMVDDVMQMRPIEGVDVPAGGSAVLEPGGKHIMLINVPELSEGDTVTLTLVFESGETLTVDAPVRPLQ